MNKYIERDIREGITYLKVGVMNVLAAIENEEIEEYNLGYVPLRLIIECAKEREWKEAPDLEFETNGWEVDCWYYMNTPKGQLVRIESSLLGQETKICCMDHDEI